MVVSTSRANQERALPNRTEDYNCFVMRGMGVLIISFRFIFIR